MNPMNKHLISGLAFAALAVAAAPALAADTCAPDKIAEKYPALAGKTINVGITAAQASYTYRDPNNL